MTVGYWTPISFVHVFFQIAEVSYILRYPNIICSHYCVVTSVSTIRIHVFVFIAF